MTALLDILARWKPVNALVVGDFMLDQIVYGDAERLSPDAPVPVLAVQKSEHRPGGAANVCLDLAALHARVRAVGLTGADAEAALLTDSLAAAGVDTTGIVQDPARPTTLKSSLVGLAQHRHPQKMFRIDREVRTPASGQMLKALLDAVDSYLAWAHVVCLEDYGKGVCSTELCQAVIQRARAAGKPVLVDPAARTDYSPYAGATLITPNRTEAELASGVRLPGDAPRTADLVPAWAALAKSLAERFRFDAVVLTLDRHGALLHRTGAQPAHIPTVARTVYDVTGAGDMVLAALAASIANGAALDDAVRFANAAAGLEVEVFGVQPIPFERIHHAVLLDQRRLAGKRRTLEEARVEVEAHRRDGRKIVFTNGVFDLLHAGHISLLRHARSLGDCLVVAINSDASVRRLKGPDRPVHSERDRAEILSELACVDLVLVFDDDTPLRLLESLRPDILVKGGQYSPEQVVGRELIESWGGRIERAPMLDGRSTTSSIERMRTEPRSPAHAGGA